ncbi:hypothetical protein ATK78_2651 [Pedobacter metabolipauper]|uniref:Uncharacterized protein n=1 Tax=Pedobacter metabolipauper TaxID=425513 RepID=A0A4R6ST34_9SPHI|nr:hypothetical protein ATK78_2651 [Pedobacter metabolipauper]
MVIKIASQYADNFWDKFSVWEGPGVLSDSSSELMLP